MSYQMELYLDFLEEKSIYEEKYVDFVNNYVVVVELTTDQIAGHLAKTDQYIKALMGQRSIMWKRPEVVKRIDAKIAKATEEKSKLTAAQGKAEPSPGADTPVPGGDVSALTQVKQKAGETGEYIKQKAGEAGDWAQKKATQAGEKIKQADAWSKEKLAGSETGEKVLGGLEKAAGKTAPVKTTGTAPGTDQAIKAIEPGGTGVAGTVQTGLHKAGVGADTATQAGNVAGQVTASPLGMATLGGAAAFGGYKLYKRFLSKGARACRGYSGGQKTACMKSYMDAKKGQVSSRGADAVGQGAVAGAS